MTTIATYTIDSVGATDLIEATSDERLAAVAQIADRAAAALADWTQARVKVIANSLGDGYDVLADRPIDQCLVEDAYEAALA